MERGEPLDDETRCVHWHGPLDVVAFRFACCEGFWPCYKCHDGGADHAALPWPRTRFEERSVLCGACRTEMTVPVYVASGSRCPSCGAGFNPACCAHWPLYFEA